MKKKIKGTAANLEAGLTGRAKTRKVNQCKPGGPRNWIDDLESDVLKMDGYDKCAIGTLEQIGREPIIIYDKALVLKQLRDDGCSELEAIEWYEYNMLGAYVGEGTPAFLVRPEDV